MTSRTITPQTLGRMLKRYEACRPKFSEKIKLKLTGKLRERNSMLMHDLASIARSGPILNVPDRRRTPSIPKLDLSDAEFNLALIDAVDDLQKERENELRIS